MDFPLSAAFSGGVSSRFVIPIYLYHACRNNARGTGAAPYCCTPRTPFSSDIPLAVLVPFRFVVPFQGCFFCRYATTDMWCGFSVFVRVKLFSQRDIFRICFLRRPHFLRGGVFLWVSLGDVEKGFGIMDTGIVIRRDGAGVSAGDCGFVGRIRRFLRKKEKYAENILLFCTFYWYQ